MARARKGEQISVRVPAFAKTNLDELPGKLVSARPREKQPRQPEIVAALVSTIKPAALSAALSAYRKELAKQGMSDFHR